MLDFTLGILGCGTMGSAILSGLLETGSISIEHVCCSVSSEESLQELRKEYGQQLNVWSAAEQGNLRVIQQADVIMVCVKPQICRTLFSADEEIRESLRGKLLISICAGVKIHQYKEWLPETAIIRAMPNTPCKIRCGMTVLAVASVNSRVTAEQKSNSIKIFSPLGRCRFLEEKHMDAVTGLSGSGPAFACVVLESLADGGVMMGLPRDVALELAAQALYGASQMVLQTKQHPAVIKDDVTTPAGCTIAGLLSMEDGKIRSTLARAIQEATLVAGGLGSGACELSTATQSSK